MGTTIRAPFLSSILLILVLFTLISSQQEDNWYDTLESTLVGSCVSSHLNAYMWKTSSLASTSVLSRNDLIQYFRGNISTNQTTKVAILYYKSDLEHVKTMWMNVKDFYGFIDNSNVFTYSFLSSDDMEYTCRPFHAFDDFDIVITSEEYFYKIVRVFRTGNRKEAGIRYTFEDFQSYSIVPMKILQFSKESNVYSIVNYLESRLDLNCTNQTVIYRHDGTEEIIYKLISNSNNGTIFENSEFQRFVSKFSPNSTELNSNYVEELKSLLISRLNYGSDSSNYYQEFKNFLRPNCSQCKNDFCADPKFIQTDYWIIPTTVMVLAYYSILFFSKVFLTPSIKRRLLVPYLPFLVVYIETQYLSGVLNYCSRARLLVLGFVINWYLITYALTVIRLYLLRNMYTLISKSKFSNSRLKMLSGDLIGILLTGGLGFILCCFISLPFYFIFLPEDQYLYSNILLAISVILGSLLSLLAVGMDLILNRKKFSKKGLSYYIFFDDPFMIRIELFSLALITILVIILGTANQYGIPDPAEIHFEELFRFFIFVLVVINSGGVFTIKYIFSKIMRFNKAQHEISDIEQFLKNDAFRNLIQEYCRKEMSLENMVCFVHLEELEKNQDNILDLVTMKDFERNYISNNSIYELNISSSLKKSFYDILKRCENSNVKVSETELSQLGESKEGLNSSLDSLPKIRELIELLKTSILQNLGDTLSRLETTNEFKHWFEVYDIQSKNQV